MLRSLNAVYAWYWSLLPNRLFAWWLFRFHSHKFQSCVTLLYNAVGIHDSPLRICLKLLWLSHVYLVWIGKVEKVSKSWQCGISVCKTDVTALKNVPTFSFSWFKLDESWRRAALPGFVVIFTQHLKISKRSREIFSTKSKFLIDTFFKVLAQRKVDKRCYQQFETFQVLLIACIAYTAYVFFET